MVKGLNKKRGAQVFVIEDSREGWVDSVGALIDAYFDNGCDLVCAPPPPPLPPRHR
jgi:hypothetical protein